MQSPSLSDLQRPILVPTGDSSLNVAFESSNLIHNRKRKSSDIEPGNNGPQSDVFAARLLSPKHGPLNFAPVTLVARSCLPLAWLDASGTCRTIFEATILSVEEWEQRILLVRQVPNGGLHAVERIAQDIYVACALHSWVSESWCHDAAIGKVAEVKVDDLLRGEGDGSLRTSHTRTGSVSSLTALPAPKSPKKPTNRRGALARMSILKPKDRPSVNGSITPLGSPDLLQQSTTASLGDQAGQDINQISSPDAVMQSPAIPPSNVLDVPIPATTYAGTGLGIPLGDTITRHEALLPAPAPLPASENPTGHERLRTQYFDHLYTSKTSLAFYVKGPLSRARAHVRSGGDPAKPISELSEFYEQSILPTKKIDLKYKESLVKIIKELPLMIVEQGGRRAVGQDASQKKKSRKKKAKLGKDCLWPDEEEFIAKWWRGRDLKAATSLTTSRAEEMRKELADLRMRESEMQMLLILEVMLLEIAGSRLSETAKPVQATDPDVKVESIEGDGHEILATTPQKPPKEKKRRNWSSELDTIVDRLCIWHTVSLDDLTATADRSQSNGSSSTPSKPNDSLKDFCKDVLLPFYSIKLPEQVKSICRKLGGPEVSPKRSKQPAPAPTVALHRSSSISSLTKSKPARPLAKRTLERVLSEDHQLHRHTSPTTTFSRSSSVTASVTHNPIIPALKREPSERPVSRGGNLSKSVSFSNREIDLAADQKVHEQKRRKLDRLAQQKRELEAAIDALKKPDRRTVAGLFMDEVEDRKSKEKERKPAVQISATPRVRRIKESLQEPELPQPPQLKIQQDAGTVIPSSTIKARPLLPGIPSSNSTTRSSATKRAVLAAIHETPSRGAEKKTSNPLNLPAVCLPSSKAVDQFTIAATPASKRTILGGGGVPLSDPDPPSGSPGQVARYEELNGAHDLHMTRSRRPVLFTPVKRSDVPLDHVFRDAPEIPEQAGRMMDRVMGGKGRGMMDDSFQWSQGTDGLAKTPGRGTVEQKHAPMEDVEEGDIYDKLGWNDDFDL